MTFKQNGFEATCQYTVENCISMYLPNIFYLSTGTDLACLLFNDMAMKGFAFRTQ